MADEICESVTRLKVTACKVAAHEGILEEALDGLLAGVEELPEEIAEESACLEVMTWDGRSEYGGRSGQKRNESDGGF